jgi:hypothetical protein
MSNVSAVDTVLSFLDRINQHDVDKLAESMTMENSYRRTHGVRRPRGLPPWRAVS